MHLTALSLGRLELEEPVRNRPVSIGSHSASCLVPRFQESQLRLWRASLHPAVWLVSAHLAVSCKPLRLCRRSPRVGSSKSVARSPPTGGLAKPGSSPPPWQPEGLHPASTWSLRPLQRNKTKYSAGGHRSNSSTNPPRHTSSLRFAGSLLSWSYLSSLSLLSGNSSVAPYRDILPRYLGVFSFPCAGVLMCA